jgi:hypothetical protein
MSLTPNQTAILRDRVLAPATDLRSIVRTLVDRRHELLEKQRDRQRHLQREQRQCEQAGVAVAFPLTGGRRAEALAPFDQRVANAQASLDQVNADIRTLDEKIDKVKRDQDQAVHLADRILEHEGLDEDLQCVGRIIRS